MMLAMDDFDVAKGIDVVQGATDPFGFDDPFAFDENVKPRARLFARTVRTPSHALARARSAARARPAFPFCSFAKG